MARKISFTILITVNSIMQQIPDNVAGRVFTAKTQVIESRVDISARTFLSQL